MVRVAAVAQPLVARLDAARRRAAVGAEAVARVPVEQRPRLGEDRRVAGRCACRQRRADAARIAAFGPDRPPRRRSAGCRRRGRGTRVGASAGTSSRANQRSVSPSPTHRAQVVEHQPARAAVGARHDHRRVVLAHRVGAVERGAGEADGRGGGPVGHAAVSSCTGWEGRAARTAAAARANSVGSPASAMVATGCHAPGSGGRVAG